MHDAGDYISDFFLNLHANYNVVQILQLFYDIGLYSLCCEVTELMPGIARLDAYTKFEHKAWQLEQYILENKINHIAIQYS